MPKSTLFDKLKHFSTIDCRKGPSTVLSADEESNCKVDFILFGTWLSCYDNSSAQLRTKVSDR